jgi:hypothetical protein
MAPVVASGHRKKIPGDVLPLLDFFPFCGYARSGATSWTLTLNLNVYTKMGVVCVS